MTEFLPLKKRSAFRLKTDPLAWPSTPNINVSNISDGLFYTHFYRPSSAGMRRDRDRHERTTRGRHAGVALNVSRSPSIRKRKRALERTGLPSLLMPLSFIYRTMCILREKRKKNEIFIIIIIFYYSIQNVSQLLHTNYEETVAVSTRALGRPLFKKGCCKKTVLTRSCVSFLLLIYVEMFQLYCLYFSSSPLHC